MGEATLNALSCLSCAWADITNQSPPCSFWVPVSEVFRVQALGSHDETSSEQWALTPKILSLDLVPQGSMATTIPTPCYSMASCMNALYDRRSASQCVRCEKPQHNNNSQALRVSSAPGTALDTTRGMIYLILMTTLITFISFHKLENRGTERTGHLLKGAQPASGATRFKARLSQNNAISDN